MKRSLRLAARLAALAVILGAAPAFAGLPSPGNVVISTNRINLVGYSSFAADPLNAADSTEYKAKLTVTVRDLANNPIPGLPVVIDFSGCTSDVRISAAQSYHAQTTGCASALVQDYTTADGSVSFVVMGGLAGRTDHPAGCARVFVDSYFAGNLGVGAFDQTGSGGMTLADIAWFWSDVGSGGFHDRSDLNGDGALTLADLAYAWRAMGARFDASGVPLCP
jgi:hypothetical protein